MLCRACTNARAILSASKWVLECFNLVIQRDTVRLCWQMCVSLSLELQKGLEGGKGRRKRRWKEIEEEVKGRSKERLKRRHKGSKRRSWRWAEWVGGWWRRGGGGGEEERGPGAWSKRYSFGASQAQVVLAGLTT